MSDDRPDAERVRALVSGRVQGIGFRYFVMRRARELDLAGWVRNLRSGDVEFVAEGPRADLEKLIASARSGPPMSWVEKVSTTWSPARGDVTSFDLTYTV